MLIIIFKASGTATCVREVALPRCPAARPHRDHHGICQPRDVCDAQCGGGLGGTFIATLGLCECRSSTIAALTLQGSPAAERESYAVARRRLQVIFVFHTII